MDYNKRLYPHNSSDAQPPSYIPPVNPHYQESSYIPSAPPSESPSDMPRPYYSAIPIPQQYIIISSEPSRHFPVNAALFLLGFVVPGLWCIGAWCWKRNDKYEIFWRRLNIIMTWISIIIMILWTLCVAILMKEELDNGGFPPTNGNDGDLPDIGSSTF